MSKSEFGRGYATCLRQFLNHRKRLDEYVRAYASMKSKTREPGLFGADHALGLWMNGASDHLYELKRPVRGISRLDWWRAKQFQDRCLDIGHGFSPGSSTYREEVDLLLETAEELLRNIGHIGLTDTLSAAMVTDGVLGLRPDSGTWSCPLDLEVSL